MILEHEAEPDADDAAIDVLLAERLAGETPPDLVALVGRRRRAGDGERAAAACATAALPPRATRGRWLVAALMLLGIGGVVAVQWSMQVPSSKPGDAAKPAAAPAGGAPQDPSPPAAEARSRGTVSLRIEDRNGGPVQLCTMTILAVLNAEASRFGRVPDQPERTLHPRDFQDGVVVLELGAGTYVVRVVDDQHAPTLSAPFSVVGDKPTSTVTVRLNVGGEVSGVAQDPDGKPVAGAVVRSQSDLAAQGGAPRVFAQLLERQLYPVHTPAEVRTDAEGRFRLRGLTYGKYSLRIEHASFCVATIPDVVLEAKPLVLEPRRLQPGAIVAGVARVAGKAEAGVTVIITLVDGSEHPASWRATSGEDGAFELGVRLPPGKYSIAAMVEDPNPMQKAMQKLVQLRDSTREFAIAKGEDRVVQDVALPK